MIMTGTGNARIMAFQRFSNVFLTSSTEYDVYVILIQ